MSCTTTKGAGPLLLRLAPLLIPFALLFCGGILLTGLQSLGVATPIPSPLSSGQAYHRLFSDPIFYQTLVFSLFVALCSALGAVFCALLLSYGLWRLPAHLTRFSLVYKIPLILPHIAVAFVIMLIWSRTGILASMSYHLGLISTSLDFPNVLYSGWGLGMILAYILKGTPFAMLLISALLVSFDPRLMFTARMLGASRLRAFFQVFLPHLWPAVNTAFIILFLYAFGAFDIPFLLGESKPEMLSIRVYTLYFQKSLARRPEAMAILVIMFVFAVAFIALYTQAVQGLRSSERKV